MFNINKENIAQAEQALVVAYNDLIAFGKIFLGADFKKSETPFFHYTIADELIKPTTQPCAIIVPRGHGKTVLLKCKIIRDFCFSQKAYEWGLAEKPRNLFYGWVSNSQRKSMLNVKYVRQHLSYNSKIQYYFGNLSGRGIPDKTYTKEDIETANNNRLISRSNLSSLRGETEASLESGTLRYSAVFIDDAENEENTKTQNSRDNMASIIMDGIFPAIDKQEGRMFVVGTPVHYDSFIQRILNGWKKAVEEGRQDEYSWRVLTWGGATQPSMLGGVLWSSWMSEEILKDEKQRLADSPRGISGYYQEYELQVQSEEDAVWTKRNIKCWEGYYEYDKDNKINFLNIKKEGEHQKIPVLTFIGCDPATDIETKKASFSVILVIAVDADNNVYVLEYERHKAIPTIGDKDTEGKLIGKKGVVDYIIDLYNKYHCSSATVEDVAMTRSVMQSLNTERRRLNRFDISVIPEPVPTTQKKLDRIYSRLSGRFSMGVIYMREGHYDLINEVLTFGPQMATNDVVDSLDLACLHAYPPNVVRDEEKKDVWHKPRRRAKSWIVA